MTNDILQLYPVNGTHHKLDGLYLSQNIRQQKCRGDVFIYSNFITSIDGRIALPAADKKTRQVPSVIGNTRDWRLYQELAAQADLLITSARYFRQAEAHEEQDNLPIGPSSEFDDLREWRRQHGLSEQPDIAIFSASLDIPAASLEVYKKRKIMIFTGQKSDPKLREMLSRESHAEIVICGKDRYVEGAQLRHSIKQKGYKYTYAIAGPTVFHTLTEGQALDRLYLTTAHKILGGREFDTIAWGETFKPAANLALTSLFLDPKALEGLGQTLAVYDVNKAP